MSIRPFFRWYDLWIGVYVDVAKRAAYICPIPMFGIKVSFPPRARQGLAVRKVQNG